MNTCSRSQHRLVFGWSYRGQLRTLVFLELGKKNSFLSAGGIRKARDAVS